MFTEYSIPVSPVPTTMPGTRMVLIERLLNERIAGLRVQMKREGDRVTT